MNPEKDPVTRGQRVSEGQNRYSESRKREKEQVLTQGGSYESIELPKDPRGMKEFIEVRLQKYFGIVTDIQKIWQELNQFMSEGSQNDEAGEELVKKAEVIVLANFSRQFMRETFHTVILNKRGGSSTKLEGILMNAGYTCVERRKEIVYFQKSAPAAFIPTKHALVQLIKSNYDERKREENQTEPDEWILKMDVRDLRFADVAGAGDLVLVIVANSLSTVTGFYPYEITCFHYTGDEFYAIVRRMENSQISIPPHRKQKFVTKIINTIVSCLSNQKALTTFDNGVSYKSLPIQLKIEVILSSSLTEGFAEVGLVCGQNEERSMLAHKMFPDEMRNSETGLFDARTLSQQIIVNNRLLRIILEGLTNLWRHCNLLPANWERSYGLAVCEGYSNPYIDEQYHRFPFPVFNKTSFNKILTTYLNDFHDGEKTYINPSFMLIDIQGLKLWNEFGRELADWLIVSSVKEILRQIAINIKYCLNEPAGNRDSTLGDVIPDDQIEELLREYIGDILVSVSGGRIVLCFLESFFKKLEKNPKYFWQVNEDNDNDVVKKSNRRAFFGRLTRDCEGFRLILGETCFQVNNYVYWDTLDVTNEEKIGEGSEHSEIRQFFETAQRNSTIYKMALMKEILAFDKLRALHSLLNFIREIKKAKQWSHQDLVFVLKKCFTTILGMSEPEVKGLEVEVKNIYRSINVYIRLGGELLRFQLSVEGVLEMFIYFSQIRNVSPISSPGNRVTSDVLLPFFILLSKRSRSNIEMFKAHLERLIQYCEGIPKFLEEHFLGRNELNHLDLTEVLPYLSSFRIIGKQFNRVSIKGDLSQHDTFLQVEQQVLMNLMLALRSPNLFSDRLSLNSLKTKAGEYTLYLSLYYEILEKIAEQVEYLRSKA